MELTDKVTKLSAEKDSAKNSLLELEIAHHESEANVGTEREKVKLDLAKVVTEKETLEMTLELRDKELKAKKEEFRKKLANMEASKADSVKETQMKSVRISSLEAELLHLKNKLSEESSNLLVATANNDKLESSVQFLEETVQIKEKYVTTVQKVRIESELKGIF